MQNGKDGETTGMRERPVTAREAALSVLESYRRMNTPPDTAFEKFAGSLPTRERALAKRLYDGTLQNQALCDFYASCYSSIQIKKLEPRVLDILRISIYQLVFLTKVPHSAAVNEGVALAKKLKNPRAAGFINAVLRKITTAVEDNNLPQVSGNDCDRLSIMYSHPKWLVRELLDLLGVTGAEALLSENNASDLALTAQVNTLRTCTDDVLSELTESGVCATRHEWLDDCVCIRGAGAVDRLKEFNNGHIYIQDAASRLAVIAAGPKPRDFIIDGCAAPGGKSFAAAIAMKNTGVITAFDINRAKLRQIEQGAGRMGLSIIRTVQKETSDDAGVYRESGDIVLADVPCSGLGVIRRKPDIRYKNESDIARLPDLQKTILKELSLQVKPGGVLLYSTCTVLKRENEEVVDWFLQDNKHFKTEGFTIPGAGSVPEGKITLFPHIHGTDGFFICKLRKS